MKVDLGVVSRWVAENAARLADEGITVSVTAGPADRDKCATWVDFESEARMARVVVWDSGEANLTAADIASGAVDTEEHMEITSEFGIQQVLSHAVSNVHSP